MCRILHNHGVSADELATKYQRSLDYIGRIIHNDSSIQDDSDDDYNFVDAQTKVAYPPKVRLFCLFLFLLLLLFGLSVKSVAGNSGWRCLES